MRSYTVVELLSAISPSLATKTFSCTLCSTVIATAFIVSYVTVASSFLQLLQQCSCERPSFTLLECKRLRTSSLLLLQFQQLYLLNLSIFSWNSVSFKLHDLPSLGEVEFHFNWNVIYTFFSWFIGNGSCLQGCSS